MGATGYAFHHPLCQTLVMLAGTPHAATNAVMLPHSIRMVAARAPTAIGKLALATGASSPDPDLAAEQVARVASRAGCTRLEELGVERSALGEVAAAVSGRLELDATPGGAPSEDDLRRLLEAAF